MASYPGTSPIPALWSPTTSNSLNKKENTFFKSRPQQYFLDTLSFVVVILQLLVEQMFQKMKWKLSSLKTFKLLKDNENPKHKFEFTVKTKQDFFLNVESSILEDNSMLSIE